MKRLVIIFAFLISACSSSEVELAGVLMSYEDLVDAEADQAAFWKSNKINLDCTINYFPDHECIATAFLPSSETNQPIIYHLVRFEDAKTAEAENKKTQATIGITGKELEFDTNMSLPDDIWYMVAGSNLHVGFSLDRYNFVVLMTKLPGGDAETLRGYLSLVVQKQVELIEYAIE